MRIVFQVGQTTGQIIHKGCRGRVHYDKSKTVQAPNISSYSEVEEVDKDDMYENNNDEVKSACSTKSVKDIEADDDDNDDIINSPILSTGFKFAGFDSKLNLEQFRSSYGIGRKAVTALWNDLTENYPSRKLSLK